ncbi:MAG: NAD(P)-dependent oxidoreductase [Deltaproteobacteria bacterium]|nr:NAD(P)-dependent oxidoreductase [Deltaproteobacteria bacterium]
MDLLITGATGFAGSALARRLISEGARVTVLVRERVQVAQWQAAGAVAKVGAIGDPNEIAEAARGCEIIFHCAGENSHRTPPRALQWINIAGTENVISAARHIGCKRVVYLSCADVTLLNCDRVNWNENRSIAQQPINPCACSKQLAEEVALTASRKSTEITAIRAAWLWGPGDHTALPGLCLEAEQGGVRLFGNGRNLIATLYIDNLVDALISACQARDVSGKAYYVTDGEFLDAAEFFGMLCESVRLPPPRKGLFYLSFAQAWFRERLRLDGPWTTDVVRRGRGTLFDTQCAVRDLGYRPSVSVAEGMARLRDWAEKVGGPGAIASMARKPATERSIEEQVAAAKAARETSR